MARLQEVLGEEPEAERIAVIVGGLLGIEDSPPAPDEMFWAIRKTFEALARRRPLILVFDDVHWGEPTFLDLVDHVAEWTRDAPILLIAMARAELLEKRPTWGGGKRWVTTMSLEPLSDVESDELVASLLGRAELPTELRSQIGHAAEGNPLFVEELLGKLIDDGFLVTSGGGWSATGDLAELTIPPSINALLAARLDGLNGEERTVIERASVEGKIFHRGAVTELAPEPMRGQVRDRLASLMRMELVRPDQPSFAGEEAFRFRHLLIRDAAYQALAKQTRAELHERFAGWLERVAADRQAEYEEIVAYHLEQAYQYRIELGPPDAHAQELALRAGTMLADAGERAHTRGDVSATVDLLGRAVELLPEDLPRRRRLLTTVGWRCYDAGDGPRAERVLTDAVAASDRAGDEGGMALAALGLGVVRMSTHATEMSETMRELDRLAGILARVGDDVGARVARAQRPSTLFAMGRAGEAGRQAKALLDLGEINAEWIALGQDREEGIPGLGPYPHRRSNRRTQLADGPRRWIISALSANRGLARLYQLQGRFDEARRLNAIARNAFEELGDRHELVNGFAVEGRVEHMAGNLAEAARLSRQGYDGMAATGDQAFASTFAVEFGMVLVDLADYDEAWRFGTIARETSSTDDVISQAGGRAVQARVLSARGDHAAAEVLAREAVAIMAQTDYLAQHGDARVHLARVLREAGRTDEAVAACREAVALYEQKEATFIVERTQRLIDEWTS